VEENKSPVTRRIHVEISIPSDVGSFEISFKTGDDCLLIQLPSGLELSSEQVEEILAYSVLVGQKKTNNRDGGRRENLAEVRQRRARARSHVETILVECGIDLEICQVMSINKLAEFVGRKLGITTRQITRWMTGESSPDDASIASILANMDAPPEKIQHIVEIIIASNSF